MQVTPLTADRLGTSPDHPEGLAIGPDGTIWCGGEAGQIYRISADNRTAQLATTGGFVLGVALDGAGRVHLCDWGLAPGTVPDGLAFAADGQLLIGCYAPDCILLGDRSGNTQALLTDTYGDLLNRPSNVALSGDHMYCANLGGWHITRTRTELTPLALPAPLIT